MSGPDERRGTDGGEHPLDVDARFADIVAHFHDGEPAPPRVVDGLRGTEDDGRDGAGSTASSLDAARGTDGLDGLRPDPGAGATLDRPGSDVPDPGSASPGDRSPVDGSWVDGSWLDGPGTDASRADEVATDWAARYEQAAREERAAHEERLARQAREARIAAEVDRAVDGPGHRFVPEEPPPMPVLDLPGRLAWGAVLLGPLALVLFALLWRSAPPWVLGSVVTAVVVGFGYLVWRLPRTHDRDDGGDGAIV